VDASGLDASGDVDRHDGPVTSDLFPVDSWKDCGLCNASCSSGTSCTSGSCQCLAPKQMCGGLCIDTQTSSSNCGSCGNACPSPQKCVGGGCV